MIGAMISRDQRLDVLTSPAPSGTASFGPQNQADLSIP